MYNNEVRVANTATPSFTTQTNVGQYGWTESDQGRFNQLLQYVDLCKQYSDHIDEVTTYVESIAKYIHDLEPALHDVENSIDTVKTYQRIVESDKNTVQGMVREVTALKVDFDTKYQGFVTSTAKFDYEITFRPNWVSHGQGYLPAKAIKVGSLVKLQGLVAKGIGATTEIGRLPDGTKPSAGVITVCACGGGFVVVEISSEGLIVVREGDSPNYEAAGWISLENISYYLG